MHAASAAWEALAAELQSTASSYRSIIKGLTTDRWMGPSSLAMASAFGPYVAWMAGAAARASETAGQARLAAEVYEAAHAMTVPPGAVATNRAELVSLMATNFLGQNSSAIAANEAQYAEMWAQDAAAMYAYAAGSSEATQVTQYNSPPEVVNQAGVAAQGTNSASQATGAGAQATLSKLVSATPTTLNNLASPLASTGTSGTAASTGGTVTTGIGGTTIDSSGLATSILASYATIPGWFGMFAAGDAIGPLIGTPMNIAMSNANAAALVPAAAAAAAPAAAVPAALGSGVAGGAGALSGLGAGLGQSAAVGGLSVPATWGFASANPLAMLGNVPLAMPGAGFDAGMGAPLIFGGLPRAAAAGAGVAAVAKYGPRASVVARSPEAGYGPESGSPAPIPFPGAAGLPPAPGYTPAIVYLPTNGHVPSNV
jgi:PPE-repeat protein